MFKSTVIGNAGQEPITEVNPTTNQSYTTFSLAVSIGKDKTQWMKIITQNKNADICKQWVHKGKLLLVMGTTKVSTYVNKSNEPVVQVSIFADEIKLLGGKVKDEVVLVPEKATEPVAESGLLSDIPF